jgi:hypothetical protein
VPEDVPVDVAQTWGRVIPFIKPKAGARAHSVLLRHLVDHVPLYLLVCEIEVP